MLIEVNSHQVFAGTGGKIFDSKKPVIIYLHGSGFSHIAWVPLAGQFTQSGYSVLVLDFPGHGNSEGKALSSIEDSALWLKELLKRMELNKVSLIGHSQGALTALEFSSSFPDMVSKLCLMNTSHSMPVHPDLIKMAETDDNKVIDLMLKWCYAGHSGNIMTEHGQIMTNKKSIDVAKMILSSKKLSDVLAIDLKACDNYSNGMNSAKKINCPTMILSGDKDKMISIEKAKELHHIIDSSRLEVVHEAGHMLASEEVVQVRKVLSDFFRI